MSLFANVTFNEHDVEAWRHMHGPANNVNDIEAGTPLTLELDPLFLSVDVDCFNRTEKAGALSAAGFGREQLVPGAGSVATPTRTLQGSSGRKSTHAVTGPRQASSSKSPGLRTCSQLKRQYQKSIVDATCLRMMYVPTNMHRGLSMASMYPMQPSGRRKNTCVVYLSAAPGSSHPVTMTRSILKRPHHRRLSTGWRDFCVSAGVHVGDTLAFSPGRYSNELRVRVTGKSKQSGLQRKATAPISNGVKSTLQ